MIKLTNANGQILGPFKTVEVLADRYKCDQEIELLFSVVGQCQQSEWVGPLPDLRDPEQLASDIRAERNQKLSDCDWTQLDDTPLTNAKKLEWATYRQALRDVSAQEGFPWDVTWPDAPAS